jgi:hypothetical protein
MKKLRVVPELKYERESEPDSPAPEYLKRKRTTGVRP